MKLTKTRLGQIIKEELKAVLKEGDTREPYMVGSGYEGNVKKRWNDSPFWKKAVYYLEDLERNYPVLIGSLIRDPYRRDACLQELSAALRDSYDGRLNIERRLALIEKVMVKTLNEPDV